MHAYRQKQLSTAAGVGRGEAYDNGPSTFSSVCGRKIEVGNSVQGTQSVLGVGLGTCFVMVGFCYCWVFAVVKSFAKYGDIVIHDY